MQAMIAAILAGVLVGFWSGAALGFYMAWTWANPRPLNSPKRTAGYNGPAIHLKQLPKNPPPPPPPKRLPDQHIYHHHA